MIIAYNRVVLRKPNNNALSTFVFSYRPKPFVRTSFRVVEAQFGDRAANARSYEHVASLIIYRETFFNQFYNLARLVKYYSRTACAVVVKDNSHRGALYIYTA